MPGRQDYNHSNSNHAARVGGVMAEAGLTIGQFGVLEALLHHGPLCQRDLGQKLLRLGGVR